MKPYPSIAIVTAIPKETAAVKKAITLVGEEPIYLGPTNLEVTLGILTLTNHITKKNVEHCIALCCLPKYANNMSAIVTTELSNRFPSIEHFILVGIAGGVPSPSDSDRDVILGDVVFCAEGGIISYLSGSIKGRDFIIKEASPLPSARLLNALNSMRVSLTTSNAAHWLDHVTNHCKHMGIIRPSPESEIRNEDKAKRDELFKENPLIRFGMFGSGNVVMGSKEYRDYFAEKYRLMAFEMEGAGLAESTWFRNTGYLIIKSICDYSDENKNKIWQEYCTHVATAALTYYLSFLPQSNTLSKLLRSPTILGSTLLI